MTTIPIIPHATHVQLLTLYTEDFVNVFHLTLAHVPALCAGKAGQPLGAAEAASRGVMQSGCERERHTSGDYSTTRRSALKHQI